MKDAQKGSNRGPGDPQPKRPPRASTDEALGRFLAFILRHHPEEIGLALDDQGAVDLDVLLDRIRTRPGLQRVTRERLEGLASGEAATRFEILGNRIRARYGHSLPQTIRYEPATPPPHLFHGSTPEAAEQILREGLKAVQRQRVHLSVDKPAAREVGRRRCTKPVILRIDTTLAAKAGIKFFPAGPAVWLSEDLPPECIARHE